MRTRRKIAAVAGFLTLMFSPAAMAGTTQNHLDIGLEEAVTLALRDNRDLRSLRMWRVLDRFDLFLAHRAYWPSGGVAVSAIRRKSDTAEKSEEWAVSPTLSWHSPVGTSAALVWSRQGALDGDGEASDSFSATVRQPLLKGAGLDVNMAPLRQAHLDAELARLREEEAVAGLIDQVTYAYRDLIEAQERRVLARLSLERSQALLETNQLLIDAGRMAAADIVQTQSEVASQEVGLLEAERTLNTVRVRLLTLLALDPSMRISAVDEVVVEAMQIDPNYAVAEAMARRRDLKARRLGIEQLHLAEKLARNSRLWDVSVVAGYDRFSANAGGQDLSSHSVGLQLNIPLGDFSGRRNVMAARTALHTSELALEGDLERIEAQVREAVADVHSRWRQLEAALRAKALVQRSLELQNERLQAGRATNFEVLSLQASLRNADAQALSARLAYLNVLTALDQQTGRTLDVWQISLER